MSSSCLYLKPSFASLERLARAGGKNELTADENDSAEKHLVTRSHLFIRTDCATRGVFTKRAVGLVSADCASGGAILTLNF